jgi:DNA-directed RNA polymerase specialized sigma24 family protein
MPVTTARDVDPILRPFCQDLEEAEWQRLAGDLVSQHVEPVVRSVVRQRLGVSLREPDAGAGTPDAEDIRSEVLVHFFHRLRGFKSYEEPIADLRGYVAVMAHHGCDEYFRRKHPERARLKNRLRYALSHRPELALWAAESGGWLCGLVAWRGQRPTALSGPGQPSRDDPGTWLGAGFRDVDGRGKDTVDLLTAIFAHVGRPLELDELVGLVAALRGIGDVVPRSEARRHPRGDAGQDPVDPHPSVATEVEQRLYLQRLWAEVRALPPRQRAALLLNLRDRQGGGILSLLPLTGVASIPDIAAALEMSAPAFASLWNDLPLDDAAIAERLGLTRQQVINLRKSARERLARRLGTEGL